MIRLLTRRVRIATVTIVALVIVTLLSAPTSVLSIVLGDDDHPLLPASPALQLASAKAASSRRQSLQKKQDVQPGRVPAGIGSVDERMGPAMEPLEHQARELTGALLTDDPIELTQIPLPLDGDSLWDGSDSLQAGHLPLFASNDSGPGFFRGGVPFLPGVGGFGSAASGGGPTSDSESPGGAWANEAAAADTGDRGTPSEVGLPGAIADSQAPVIVSAPGLEENGAAIGLVVEGAEVSRNGGNGLKPPSDDRAPQTPVSAPEPASLLLTGLGVAGLVLRNRRTSRVARQQTHQANLQIPGKRASNLQ